MRKGGECLVATRQINRRLINRGKNSRAAVLAVPSTRPRPLRRGRRRRRRRVRVSLHAWRRLELFSMSLYTPIFPATDVPPRQATQSSYTSVDTGRTARMSYSSRLSQWHLGIASLPEILCPPSPPRSECLKERSEKLQAEIEQAVRDRRAVPDHCKLLCVRRSATTEPYGPRPVDAANPTLGPLVDTEEEWLEWEAKVAETRSRPNGIDHALAVLANRQTGGAREKVLHWKAALQQQQQQQAGAGAPPATASQPPAGSSQTQSTLGFPVVKRSSLVKESRTKPRAPNHEAVSSLFKPPSRSPREARRAASPEPVNIRGSTANMETEYTTQSKAESHMPPVVADNDLLDSLPTASPKYASHPHPDFSVRICYFPRQQFTEALSQDVPPPSFPADIPTSTPKQAQHQSQQALVGFRTCLPPDPPTSQRTVPAHVGAVPQNSSPEPQPRVMDNAGVSENTPFVFEPAKLRMPQPTPPSPPYTSRASPEAQSRGSRNAQAMDVTASPETNAQPTTEKDVRPMTPPSEDSARDSSLAATGADVLRSPPAPRENVLQDGSRPIEPTSLRSSTPDSSQSQGAPVLPSNALAAPTPDATINGLSSAKTRMDLDALYLSKPASASASASALRTPERARAPLPATSELLATSRRSAPRPRPPSRKNSIVLMDVDGDELVDPSPAKSDRSYFSSPASSSSSSGSDASVALSYMRSKPPDSPTGFGFTQDPDKFAPIGESTVFLKNSAARSQRLHSLSPTTRLRAISQSEAASQSQSQLSGKRGSSGFGMYNSQFDVDGQVDKLSTFLARDVDPSYWDRAPGKVLVEGTDDEDDEDDVEQLTFALSPV